MIAEEIQDPNVMVIAVWIVTLIVSRPSVCRWTDRWTTSWGFRRIFRRIYRRVRRYRRIRRDRRHLKMFSVPLPHGRLPPTPSRPRYYRPPNERRERRSRSGPTRAPLRDDAEPISVKLSWCVCTLRDKTFCKVYGTTFFINDVEAWSDDKTIIAAVLYVILIRLSGHPRLLSRLVVET